MSTLIQKSFSLNLTAMRVFGLYPPDSHKSLYRILTYLLYVVLIVPIPILQCLNLYVQDLSFMQVADNTFLIAELGCFIPKFWPFLNDGERIKKCIHYFDSNNFQPSKTEHVEIINDGVKMCRKTTVVFLCCVTAGFVSWCMRPISWKNHIFPTDLWLPFDATTAPYYYDVCVYVYLVLAVGYGAYTSAAVDPLIAGLAYQATTQIKILKHNLQHLEGGSDDLLLCEKIRECVIHHLQILDFVEEYQNCFSQVACSQFASGVVVFCVSCLQLTIVDVLSFDFLAMMMFLVAMLTEVYLYCHFGTILFEENSSINTAVYLSNWYEFGVKPRKMLLLLMERTKRPMVITIGKIFDMSLVTFTMILRRSYSLLAVLDNYTMGFN